MVQASKTPTRKAAQKPVAKPPPPAEPPPVGIFRLLLRLLLRAVLLAVLVFGGMILLFAVLNPPTNLYILSESRRLGGVERTWVPLEAMAPELARSVVASEDANFCLHWGFDIPAIRKALEDGAGRGASTISQQTVKNVFLWQGRSWVRKALEAVLTPAVELVWSKRRIVEVYLNIAEFDEGVFGAEAAAQHHFRVSARELTPTQAARLAAVLPNPKDYDAANPSKFVRQRATAALDGAATIEVDGRSDCFED